MIFLICPVRNASEEQKAEIAQYLKRMALIGQQIYYPATDTDQVDSVGLRICADNFNALAQAEEVHVFYDPSSAGGLFDLGMAFALGKIIRLVNKVEPTPTKSFGNVLLALDEQAGELPGFPANRYDRLRAE